MASKLITKQTIAVGLSERVTPNLDINVTKGVLIMPSTNSASAASWDMYYDDNGHEAIYSYIQATLGANVAAVIVTMNNTSHLNWRSYTALLKIDTMETTSVSFVLNETYITNAVLNSDGNTEITVDFFGSPKIFTVTGNQL